jgi:uncharacterized protein HemX
MSHLPPEVLAALLAALIAVVWALLKKKDSDQETQIKLLFAKHDEDAKALQELRVQIAEKHYVKTELDSKFDKLEVTIKESFKELSIEFRALSAALLDHIKQEDARK